MRDGSPSPDALLGSPTLLLLDEPAAGLLLLELERLRELIKAIVRLALTNVPGKGRFVQSLVCWRPIASSGTQLQKSRRRNGHHSKLLGG